MKKHSLLLSIALAVFSCLQAQNHDYNWQHGQFYPNSPNRRHFAIDFNEEPPATYQEDRELNIDATVASMCDSTGNLLFYTNGIQIANFDHEVMENGDSLNPGSIANSWYNSGYPAVQSEIILPWPNQINKYFLFHLAVEYVQSMGLSRTVLYSTLVDMAANGGAGAVLEKNIALHEPVGRRFGILSAAKHANGRDWWIFVTERSYNNYFCFLLDPEGVHGPFEAMVEPGFDLWTLGHIAFSPDGTRMGRFEVEHGLYIYDFDRCTGTLSDDPLFIGLPETSLGGGLAFSPGSRFVYIAARNTLIFQFDLWADDVAASLDTVAVYDGYESPVSTTFFLMQNGPDGRIYVNCTNTNDVLHYIDRPDRAGKDCRVVQHGLQLPFRNSFTLPHFPNFRLGPLDGSPCDTLGLDNVPVARFRYEQDSADYLTVHFTDLSHYEPGQYSWDFGDQSFDEAEDPSHAFPSPGAYEVCLTVGNANGSDTHCQTVYIATAATGETEEGPGVGLFPNPASGGVDVTLPDGYLPKKGRVIFYDAMGSVKLERQVLPGRNSVRLDGLSPGIYFYEVKDGEMTLGGGKLVVE